MNLSKVDYVYKDDLGIFHISLDSRVFHLDEDSAWIMYQALGMRLDDIDAPA